MTKLIKRITVAAVVLMALIGTGGVVAFAAGYITWGGTEDYEGAKHDLNQLETRRVEIVTNLDQARDLIADQNTLIESQKTTISEKEDKITELENDNADFEQLVKTELAKGIQAVNNTNGAGPKYREIANLVNIGAEYLGIDERLSDVNDAQAAEDKLKQTEDKLEQAEKDMEQAEGKLEQAEKDMKDIKNKTGSLLGDFNNVDLIVIPEEDGD